MQAAHPIARELVLAGGGHSHVIVLRMLGMQAIPGLRVTLVSPDSETPYSGMLPGVVAGHYTRRDAHIDLVPLCRFAGANFVRGSVEGIDTEAKYLKVAGRPPIRYDVLSIDVGSTPSPGGLPQDAVIPVKPISSFLEHWQGFLKRFAAGDAVEVGFVGGGAGGTELCLAVHHYLTANFPDRPCNLHLFTDGKSVLKEFPASVSKRFEEIMRARNIAVHRDFRAIDVADGRLVSADQREIALDEIFCTTEASAQSWPEQAGLAVDSAGFIRTEDTLQVVGHPEVFAVGDCATMVNHPRPKAGVFAVRQGLPLFKNMCAVLLGKPVQAFRPQKKFLALLTTGSKHAVASRNGLTFDGDWVWRWKNWIDQRFMQRFAVFPEMSRGENEGLLTDFADQMHCGGCGAKVSSDLLSEVLAEFFGDAVPSADAAPVSAPPGRQLLQSVDHLRAVTPDLYIQSRIAVCHAFSDIYACGGSALNAMVMLTLPFAKPDVTRGMLREVMAGVVQQLEEEGAVLIGGHTSEGMETSVGLTVNGTVAAGQTWCKTGANPGDVLILTKPLGTGVILAADMQRLARGNWVETALTMMMQSNRRAAEIIAGFSVSACTDLTGFGLAGHCREMLEDQGPGLCLDLGALPMLPGAADCLAAGVRSTLHEANRRAASVPGGNEVLYDPQTSGGLLFSLPPARAAECLTALWQAGYGEASVIGAFQDTPGISVTGG